MRLLQFEPAPLLIGFILGPLMEENFRRAMIASFGDPTQLLLRPISGTLLVAAGLLLIYTIWSGLRLRRRLAERAADG